MQLEISSTGVRLSATDDLCAAGAPASIPARAAEGARTPARLCTPRGRPGYADAAGLGACGIGRPAWPNRRIAVEGESVAMSIPAGGGHASKSDTRSERKNTRGNTK
jgi:hypothetical protein